MGNEKKSRRKPGARHYTDYSKESLNVAVDLVKSKALSSYDAEKQFGIPRRTILNKCKDNHDKPVGRPTKLSEEEETHIANVIKVAAEFGCPLSLLDLRIVVHNYLEKNERLYIFNNKIPGERWARSFLSRHNLTQRASQNVKRCRAAKSIPEMIDFYKHLEKSLEDVRACNILNFDETNLSDDPGASKAIFKRGVKHPERIINSTKTSVSIMFAGTADGVLLPPYVVYKSEHLWNRWCRNGPLNSRYNRTNSGWFDMNMFDDWFESLVIPWAKELEGPKLVIGDNLSSHLSINTIKLCQENNIRFVFLPKNATHLTQPLDLAFFGPMKREWRKILLEYKLSNATVSSISKSHFPILLNELMKNINMTSQSNLISGFAAAGICPFNPSKVTRKIPEVTEEKKKDFDNSLLEFFKTNREVNKQIKNKKNSKLSIVAGKSVSTEDAESMCLKQEKVVKRKTPKGIPMNNMMNDKLNEETNIIKSKKGKGVGKKTRAEILKPKVKKYDLEDKENDIKENINTLGTRLGSLKSKSNMSQRSQKSKSKQILLKKPKILSRKSASIITTSESGEISSHSDSDILDALSDNFSELDIENENREENIEREFFKKQIINQIVLQTDKTNTENVTIENERYSEGLSNKEINSDAKQYTQCLKQNHSLDISLNSTSIINPVKKEKVTILSSIRFAPENRAFIGQEMFASSQSRNIDVNFDLSKHEKRKYTKNSDKEIKPAKISKKINDYSMNLNIIDEDAKDRKEVKINNIDKDQVQSDTKSRRELFGEEKKMIYNEISIMNETERFNIGDKVLIRYYTTCWKYYVGVIEHINIKKSKYSICFYRTVGNKSNAKFVVPKRKDQDCVPEASIVKLIKLLQVSENPLEYVLWNEEDSIYF